MLNSLKNIFYTQGDSYNRAFSRAKVLAESVSKIPGSKGVTLSYNR